MSWVLLHKTAIYTEAAILKGKLEDNNIPVQILNKQDSMYMHALPGLHEIYVPGQLKELALSVLQEALSN